MEGNSAMKPGLLLDGLGFRDYNLVSAHHNMGTSEVIVSLF